MHNVRPYVYSRPWFDTLGFLWLHHDRPPYLLYLLEELVDGLNAERTTPPLLRSITTTTL